MRAISIEPLSRSRFIRPLDSDMKKKSKQRKDKDNEMQIENKRRKSKKKINKIKDRKKRGRKIVGCSVAAEGQIVVDYEDEFDEFGDAKCSLCQRRFEEQGKILPFDMNGISYKKK